ncbi:leucyl-tRNA synthetase [Xylariaceae sp. FL0594]|nr:leucyl-tRNA synthetase [Xylariaceae sp. FL0594]
MAYPYVNGVPHLGHAFTISKIEFAARVARAQGKRVLYPQGYHCTGMPIKACADKLANEVERYGRMFEGFVPDDNTTDKGGGGAAAKIDEEAGKTDVMRFSNTKKGKAALKSGVAPSSSSSSSSRKPLQFEVMLAIGVPRDQIHKFTDTAHWLEHFPPIWRRDMTRLGCGIDWRRSFVTTDKNPFYDAFVRWQMNKLKELEKVRFGKRLTVYSPRDGQSCLDHDRAAGEGVLVQEYTAVRCRVVRWGEDEGLRLALGDVLAKSGATTQSDDGQGTGVRMEVYLVAATLRPETLYGQTNVFVSPSVTYGVFKVSDNKFYILTARAARNMAYQGIFPEWGHEPHPIATIVGKSLIGTLVSAPLAHRNEVYVVPMDTIKESVGTGIVTSVPSDSPDDYAMTVELARKREYYGVRSEWLPDVARTDVSDEGLLSIIKTPDYGPLIAPALVQKLGIKSPRDGKKLAEAKDIVYKHGFYHGTMAYCEFEGMSVQEAKPRVRKLLLNSGDGFSYAQPDGVVISHSGDECVAALLPQWFIAYGAGDPAWREEVRAHVKSENFNAYSPETLNAIAKTLDWMDQWAVTRQFGLGTKLPWDETQVVESLSDSTVYMAYYTVAKFLHKDIYGKEPGEAGITPEQMTDQVWDYVFARSEEVDSDIPRHTLDAMRREFQYWYPLDVRVSGKDLINNHLIFMLYTHQALWGDQGSRYLPRGIRINGHAMLNGEKMAKSTGNFLTLRDAVDKYGADAVRVALADAGDGVEDSNVDETVANAVILKLYEMKQITQKEKMRDASVIQRKGPKGFWDEIFQNEMNALAAEAIESYKGTLYKSALKSAFYDLMAARDSYRVSVGAAGVGMHADTVRRYVELQAGLMAPITPHWAEYIWREVLGNVNTLTLLPSPSLFSRTIKYLLNPSQESFISLELFPTTPPPSHKLSCIAKYIRTTTRSVTNMDRDAAKRAAKGKKSSSSSSSAYDAKADKRLSIYFTRRWPEWQDRYIALVREQVQETSHTTAAAGSRVEIDVTAITKRIPELDNVKKVMPFIFHLKHRVETTDQGGKEWDNRELPFDEALVLKEMVLVLLKSAVPKLVHVRIVNVDEDEEGAGGDVAAKVPQPSLPTFVIENV